MIELKSSTSFVDVNPMGGHLDRVGFVSGGRLLMPMHRAHWRTGENNGGLAEAEDTSVAQTLRSLSGDFFCAPFANDDVTGGPEHGPPANQRWNELSRSEGDGSSELELELSAPLLGARLTRTITLKEGHPVIYQRHTFHGGDGAISFAHHPMVRTDGGVRVSMSPKQFGATPGEAIENDPARGRCALRYPQEFADLSAVELAAGGTIDLRSLPGPEGFEDFLLLAEASDSKLGWSCVLAPAQGFLFFTIRDPKIMPVSMLWLSNGGRNYAPFSSRHTNVLGIEEGRTFFNAGNAQSTAENTLTSRGIPTSLPLVSGGQTSVQLAFGAIAAPAGWTEVSSVELIDGGLRFTDVSGEQTTCEFDRSLVGL